MTVYLWNSDAQNALHRHRVAAIAPILEEAAGAVPLTIVKGRRMNIILTLEICLEAGELNTLWFFGITLGFGDLADNT